MFFWINRWDNASGQEIEDDFDGGRREGSRVNSANRRALPSCAEQSLSDRHISMNTTSRLRVCLQRSETM